MNTYISVLRGINVGGHKKVKMDALQNVYTSLGFDNARTYIQSGNVVFEAHETNILLIIQKISEKILQEFGFHVPVLVLKQQELQEIALANPFLETKGNEPEKLHISFLSEISPVTEQMLPLASHLPDELKIIGRAVYLYCPNGYGQTKLNNNFLEAKLQVTATTRNWKTVQALLLLAAQPKI